jgi:7-cyano-7-deazaguanine reductase
MTDTLTQLGRDARTAERPEDAVLERVPNPHPQALLPGPLHRAGVHLALPVTGQPDFAHLVIDYAPGDWLIESKSLKLYLTSFRNHGAFHEGCTLDIGRRIVETAQPRWLRISGYWYPRGGIPIDVFWQTGAPPRGCGCPIRACRPIRGRG